MGHLQVKAHWAAARWRDDDTTVLPGQRVDRLCDLGLLRVDLQTEPGMRHEEHDGLLQATDALNTCFGRKTAANGKEVI